MYRPRAPWSKPWSGIKIHINKCKEAVELTERAGREALTSMTTATGIPALDVAPASSPEVDPRALAEAAEQASEFLKSLANPVRLRILCLLIQGETPVGDIAEKLEARQSLISQHLALLRKDGLVRPRRDGQTIYYALSDPRAERLLGVLYETFCPIKAADLPCKAARRPPRSPCRPWPPCAKSARAPMLAAKETDK